MPNCVLVDDEDDDFFPVMSPQRHVFGWLLS